jgi:hypothetical protein
VKHKKTLIEKIAITTIAFVFIVIVLMFLGYGFIGAKLLSNPEIIGEWFSRFADGFESQD